MRSIDDSRRVRLVRRIPLGTRGKYRFARFLLGSLLDSAGPLVRDRFGFRYAVPSLREPVAFSLLVDGIYECAEMELALTLLKPGSVFVDVGANIGCYTLPIASKVAPGGRVFSIEASPKIYELLHDNVTGSGLSNIVTLECAALDADGAVDFHEAPPDHFGMGSIAPQFGKTPIRVHSRRLDSIMSEAGVEAVDLLKIDVEGYEANVLRGAVAMLSGPKPPVVMFEFVDWAEDRAFSDVGRSQRYLRELGYDMWTLSSFTGGGPPLVEPILQGASTIVAKRRS